MVLWNLPILYVFVIKGVGKVASFAPNSAPMCPIQCENFSRAQYNYIQNLQTLLARLYFSYFLAIATKHCNVTNFDALQLLKSKKRFTSKKICEQRAFPIGACANFHLSVRYEFYWVFYFLFIGFQLDWLWYV